MDNNVFSNYLFFLVGWELSFKTKVLDNNKTKQFSYCLFVHVNVHIFLTSRPIFTKL